MDEFERVDHAQLREDVGLHTRCRGGGECDDGRRVLRAAQCRQILAEHAIVGPEVVAPLRDAMRLIDGDQSELLFGQHFGKSGNAQALRRDEQKLQLASQIVCAYLACRAALHA